MTWQEKLDEMFPDGVMVTAVMDVPEHTQDSPTFLTPKLNVIEEDLEHPTIHLNILEFEKDVTFIIEKLEEFSPGVWLVHSRKPQHDFLLSNNFGPSVRDALKKARKEWYG